MRLLPLVTAAAMLSGSLVARADLTSDTFTGSFDQPQGVATTPVVTFVGGVGASIPWLFNLQITDSQVIVTMLSNGELSGNFAGPEVTDISDNPGFTEMAADPASTFVGPTATFTSDSFAINLANTGFYTGQTAIFDLQDAASAASVTPEPSSFLLLSTGLLGVAGVLRKRLA